MNQIRKNITSIYRDNAIYVDLRFIRNISYRINEEETINVELPEYRRPKKSYEIINESPEFVNGFKVVELSNGEYGYVREEDNFLLPYRYDIAFDFNEYGFAIVGKDGRVSWINKDFKYLNIDGEMVDESGYSWALFNGWRSLSNFSKGSIPLSRLYDCSGNSETISYFGIDGKLKEFYKYDGEIHTDDPIIDIPNGKAFGDKDYILTGDYHLLISDGIFIKREDLLKMFIEKGYIDSINKEAKNTLKRVLKK